MYGKLKKLLANPPKVGYGICDYLGPHKRQFLEIADDWPKFSGTFHYPIPSNVSEHSAYTLYHSSDYTRWEGYQLKMRLELIEFVLDSYIQEVFNSIYHACDKAMFHWLYEARRVGTISKQEYDDAMKAIAEYYTLLAKEENKEAAVHYQQNQTWIFNNWAERLRRLK